MEMAAATQERPAAPRTPAFASLILAMAIDKSLAVLVAEDNANLRKVLVNIVSKIGFQNILEAEDGQKAWEHIKSGKVGLLLTDWNMPVMSGLDLVMKIRSAPAPTKELPVLMITAYDTKSSVVTAGQKGVDAYIIKPFSVQTIVQKIEEAITRRKAAAAAE
jgi:two-component system chemotaxis response regulator CheY